MMQLHATKYEPSAFKEAEGSSPQINTPVVILHGLFGSNRNWHPIARSLSNTQTVFSLDLRNHGKSPHSDIMDYQHMADDVMNFIETEINNKYPGPVNIIAHSMGGKAAMWLALSHPEMISKLVVVDIAPVNYEHDFSDVLKGFHSIPLESIQSRQDADHYLSQTIKERSLRQFLLQNLQFKNEQYSWRLNLDVIAGSISNITGFPQTDNMAPFSERVLFIGGGQSDYLNRINQKITRELFPKASFSMIKSAGHWLHAEQPELFKALVEPYLSTRS
ncbi:MAG: alpha/beta fold hydrolase [Gammaproteobacteria bacterium]|nr:alpha/beta fold hydrolase [Gammaproteobacteria bacterium]